MPDIIHLLPDAIANQIAAGEVIQRPASAVKELLENAVDAGATQIKLIVKDAGKTWIQVVDNGSGMSETDARMCLERHATSKIKTAEDLFLISTMGFRGEALASIAAVAQLELKTRLHSESTGTCIIVHGSQVISQEPVQSQPGTSITIKNLFYNIPARRNFLKSNTVEMRHVVDEFQRVAMAHPALSFQLIHNEVELFHLKAGTLRQRVVALLGSQFNERLVPIEENTSVLKISGFIGKPEASRKLRGDQFLFVNHRFIKSPYLHHAITTAYENLIPDGNHPLYVLFLEIDPARIDVNVHPTKQEIKFEDERIVYTFVSTAAKHALGKYAIAPTLDFERETSFDHFGTVTPGARVQSEREAQSETNGYVPAWMPDFVIPQTAGADSYRSEARRFSQEHSSTETSSAKYTIESLAVNALPSPALNSESPEERMIASVFQIHNRYIITQIKSGYIIVDQQAAHERILYEQYMASLAGKPSESQHQLFPQTWSVGPADVELVNELLPQLQKLGFDVRPFGGTAFVIHGTPSEVLQGNEIEVLEKMLDNYKESQQSLHLDATEAMARSFAKISAIRPNKAMEEKECRTLIDRLFACSIPFYTPDGKHTFITYTLKDLEKSFSK